MILQNVFNFVFASDSQFNPYNYKPSIYLMLWTEQSGVRDCDSPQASINKPDRELPVRSACKWE